MTLSCGDFGSTLPSQKRHVLAKYSPEFLRLNPLEYEQLFTPILERTRLITCYGNHDLLDVLYALRNRDGSACWLADFLPISIDGLTVMGINGNISGKGNPWNIAKERLFAEFAAWLSYKPYPVDIMLTHESAFLPKSHPALEPIIKTIQPNFCFCGHTHIISEDRVNDIKIYNPGMMLHGHYLILDTETGEVERKKIEQSKCVI